MATQVQQAIAWARSKLGTTKYAGRCQAFVADCYAYGAGMPRKSASSAKVARALWRVSTNRNSIPVGAAVYFDSPTAPQYGHVGLYIGGGQVIHAFSTVKQMSVAFHHRLRLCLGEGMGPGNRGAEQRPTGPGNGGPAVDQSTARRRRDRPWSPEVNPAVPSKRRRSIPSYEQDTPQQTAGPVRHPVAKL